MPAFTDGGRPRLHVSSKVDASFVTRARTQKIALVKAPIRVITASILVRRVNSAAETAPQMVSVRQAMTARKYRSGVA